MNVLYPAVTFILIVAAFIAGLKLSDYYHAIALAERKYALEKQYVRLQAGMDADDPVQPYVASPDKHNFAVSPEFIDRLRTNRSASMRVDKPNAI